MLSLKPQNGSKRIIAVYFSVGVIAVAPRRIVRICPWRLYEEAPPVDDGMCA